MNETKYLIVFLVIGVLLSIVYIIYSAVKKEKENQELEEKHKKYIEEQEQKRIKERQENSVKWNNEIQSKFNGKIKYKTNKKIKVLIGDYTNSMAPFTNSALRSMSIETEVVPTASDIIDRINNGNKYDLIITNNVYPHGESGDKVLNTLKEKEDFNIPIIILTIDQNARNHYISKGFDEYIAKPLDEEKIIQTLPKVIKGLKFTKIQNKSNKS